MSAVALPLHDPTQWPLLMTKAEVAHVTRRCTKTVERLVSSGSFPEPTSDHKWVRQDVIDYCQGGVRRFDQDRKRDQMRAIAGGKR